MNLSNLQITWNDLEGLFTSFGPIVAPIKVNPQQKIQKTKKGEK